MRPTGLWHGNIFLHYFDRESISLFYLNKNFTSDQIVNEFKLATKIAYLMSKKRLIFPLSNYFESPYLPPILRDLGNVPSDNFYYATGAVNFQEFLEHKRVQYENDPTRYPKYFQNENDLDFFELHLRQTLRRQSTTEDIRKEWDKQSENWEFWNKIKQKSRITRPYKFKRIITDIPNALGDRAFISPYVVPFLEIKKEPIYVRNRINILITKEYVSSYLTEYNAVCLTDFSLFDTSPILPENRNHISIKKIVELLKARKQMSKFIRIKGKELIEFKKIFWEELYEDYYFDDKTNARKKQLYKKKGPYIVISDDNKMGKCKVFIGSSWSDLKEERKLLLDVFRKFRTVQNLNVDPIAMEDFGFSSNPPIERCLEEVENAHAYLGVIGHIYGSIPKGKTESYTELEYQRAIQLKRPIFFCIQSDEAPLTGVKTEKDPNKLNKFNIFKQIIMEKHIVIIFNDANDLIYKLAIYLPPRLREHKLL